MSTFICRTRNGGAHFVVKKKAFYTYREGGGLDRRRGKEEGRGLVGEGRRKEDRG